MPTSQTIRSEQLLTGSARRLRTTVPNAPYLIFESPSLRQRTPDQHSPPGCAGLKSPTIPNLLLATCGLPHPSNEAAAFSLRAFSPKLWTAPVQYAFEEAFGSKGLGLGRLARIWNSR